MKRATLKAAVTAAGFVLAALAFATVGRADEHGTLSLAELEHRVRSANVTVKEMKVKGLLFEVEGYDASDREVELMLDRRSGEILSQKIDE